MAATAGEAWLRGAGGPTEGEAESATDTSSHDGGTAAPISRRILRPEHAAFSRKAARPTRYPGELHVGAERAARGGSGGQTAPARAAPAEACAAADARMLLHIDGSKHRW